MSVKYFGTTAAALTLGLALIASAPASAAPIGTIAADIESAIDSSVIQVARRGPPQPGLRPGVRPGLRPGIRPGIRPGLRPGIRPGLRPGIRPGLRPGIRPGFRPGIRPGFRPGLRRGWGPGFFFYGLPALGAAAVGITLSRGWYWGEYIDECRRWIVPCRGCAPAVVDLCE